MGKRVFTPLQGLQYSEPCRQVIVVSRKNKNLPFFLIFYIIVFLCFVLFCFVCLFAFCFFLHIVESMYDIIRFLVIYTLKVN